MAPNHSVFLASSSKVWTSRHHRRQVAAHVVGDTESDALSDLSECLLLEFNRVAKGMLDSSQLVSRYILDGSLGNPRAQLEAIGGHEGFRVPS